MFPARGSVSSRNGLLEWQNTVANRLSLPGLRIFISQAVDRKETSAIIGNPGGSRDFPKMFFDNLADLF